MTLTGRVPDSAISRPSRVRTLEPGSLSAVSQPNGEIRLTDAGGATRSTWRRPAPRRTPPPGSLRWKAACRVSVATVHTNRPLFRRVLAVIDRGAGVMGWWLLADGILPASRS